MRRTSKLSLLLLACLEVCGYPAIAQTAVESPRKTSVYIFLSESCSLSRYYTLPLGKLHKNFSDENIRFIGVFPNAMSTSQTVAKFKEKYKISFEHILDPDHHLVTALGATVTPEVIVVDQQNAIRYKGRIDNAFERVGIRRRIVTSFDLETALHALINGEEPGEHQAEAIGCIITRLSDKP